MPIRRRLLLAAPALVLASRAMPSLAQQADPRLAERAVGSPDAKLVVQEWLSLTSTGCAHFSASVFPEVKAKLIDTGRIRYVFRDFPLDRLALAAAIVARALPPERYQPFVESLLASQERWAVDHDDIDPLTEIGHQAALAGMPDADFRAALADRSLQAAIMREARDGRKRYDIDGTPTFIFGSSKIGPVSSYADFAAGVEKGLAKG